MRSNRSRILLMGVALYVTTAALQAEEIRATFRMFEDPLLELPPVEWRLSARSSALWRETLQRHESDLQRFAADAIARAQAAGLADFDAARPDLLRVLTADESHPAARHAAAHALIALDARDVAEPLFAASQSQGADLRQLVEPALSEWGFAPILAVWRERVFQERPRRRDLLLALAGLGRARDAESLPALQAMVSEPSRAPDVRLAAARAAGQIADAGLEDDAARLCDRTDPAVLHRLCAAALLSRHASAAARERLTALGLDPEPTVAASALGALFEQDPALVLPLLQESLRNADANVRRLGIEACLALPTPERIALVAALLDDPHPDLRRRVRDGVFQLAHRPELDVAVREAGLRVLGQDGWRGQEQAALLLGALDHEPAAGRLLERLEATRGEVAIAAAWALKALAIPETLPDVLVDVTRRTDARIQAPPPFPVFDEQVAHLLELLGELRYAPAEPLLRRHVPKNFSYGLLSRGAAIWGLGLLHEGQPDEELAAQLNERLHDLDPFNPEAPLVRQMSAITIGRMKAASQMASLRTLLGPVVGVDPVSFAIRWAILNTTGEALPIPDKVVQYRTDWFLQPLGDTESGEP